eukprot:TRINITY_DN4461_c0_g1_i1.p1 TRINITY_DN4461_c0_g1~~TRINITY_DN4461_c0_g1_i1.p1  ORF type:complete len:687 (-),score=135.66 TRINITY_DN4461_c0_g1_i1:564-2624(-)
MDANQKDIYSAFLNFVLSRHGSNLVVHSGEGFDWIQQFRSGTIFSTILLAGDLNIQSENILDYCHADRLVQASVDILMAQDPRSAVGDDIFESEESLISFLWLLLVHVIVRDVNVEKIPELMHIVSSMKDEYDSDACGLTLIDMWVHYHLNEPLNFASQNFRSGVVYLRLLQKLNIITDDEILFSSSEEGLGYMFLNLYEHDLAEYISKEAINTGDKRINYLFLFVLLLKYPNEGIYTVIFTQCIQNDFCRVLNEEEKLPCKLHVGHAEAIRILGEDPSQGPMHDFISWARAQDKRKSTIIHIRDWHDDTDPKQKNHLNTFGSHCIKGTEGAKLVCDFDENMGKNEKIINSKGLSDFEMTNMYELWEDVIKRAAGRPIYVGIIGVWTDAKVYFLAYDLVTRLNVEYLSVCSSLCASFSRTKHFQALHQMENLLNVTVCDSISDFKKFLSTDNDIVVNNLSIREDSFMAKINYNVETDFSPEEELVLRFLFRNAEEIMVLKHLVGGYSGAKVILASSTDSEGYEEGPFVVKIDNVDSITTERRNFEQVENIISNFAPKILSYHEHTVKGGLKFAFASHLGDPKSFMSVYQDLDVDDDLIKNILKIIFMVVFIRFSNSSKLEQFDICDAYNFDGKGWAWAAGGSDNPDAVKKRTKELLGTESKVINFGPIQVFILVLLILGEKCGTLS